MKWYVGMLNCRNPKHKFTVKLIQYRATSAHVNFEVEYSCPECMWNFLAKFVIERNAQGKLESIVRLK